MLVCSEKAGIARTEAARDRVEMVIAGRQRLAVQGHNEHLTFYI